MNTMLSAVAKLPAVYRGCFQCSTLLVYWYIRNDECPRIVLRKCCVAVENEFHLHLLSCRLGLNLLPQHVAMNIMSRMGQNVATCLFHLNPVGP